MAAGVAHVTARLAQLQRLAGLVREAALAEVRHAAAACAETRARLDALGPPSLPDDAAPALHRAAALHQVWADGRRAEINLTFARQRAALIEAQERAAVAVGRAEVLRRLADGPARR